MESAKPRVTIHMAASLDGFIARRDGRVDWLETSDHFDGGHTMTPESVAEFLKTIDCYVMGSRTYETALDFEAKGFGWAYGDKPTFVLTRRHLAKTRDTVEFYSGDLGRLVSETLAPRFRNVWLVGGAHLCQSFLEQGFVDEIRLSIAPVLLGDGLSLFGTSGGETRWRLMDVVPYKTGFVELVYRSERGSR